MARLLIVLVVALARLASAQTAPQGITGVGAHPLSDAVAATWFIESTTESTKRLAAIIYLVGTPGWTGEPTDWKWEWGNPAFSYFKVAGSEIRADYYPSTRRLVVLTHDAPLSEANVVVVRGVGQGKLRVAYSEHAELEFESGANPSVALLYRSRSLRAELSRP